MTGMILFYDYWIDMICTSVSLIYCVDCGSEMCETETESI